MIEAAGGDERLGVCLDTQHLWASGIPFGTVEEADDLVDWSTERSAWTGSGAST